MLFISIHDIPFNLFLSCICGILLFLFTFLYIASRTNTDWRLIYSTVFNQNLWIWIHMSFFSYVRCVNNFLQHWLLETFYVSSYITFLGFLILTWYLKHLTHFFHWINHTIILLKFPIYDLHVFLQPIFRYYSFQ